MRIPVFKVLLLGAALFAAWQFVASGVAERTLAQASEAEEVARIDRAVDGDTLIVRVDGRRRRVRLLGIDTPETVKPNTPVQPCGREASSRAKQWARKHRSVRLVADPAAPDEDRYGRMLRWVEPTAGGRSLSTVQAAAGLARVKTRGQDLEQLPELRRAQDRAQRAQRGLWGDGCS